MTNGKELRLKRIAMDVATKDLAEAVGVPKSQISHWENARRVTEKAELRYLEGLATFGTVPTVVVSSDEASA